MKLKKGDNIKVISGDDRGKTGVILKVFPKTGKVLVDGINTYKKHVKKDIKNQEGGVITKSRPIWASKLELVKSETKKVSKKK